MSILNDWNRESAPIAAHAQASENFGVPPVLKLTAVDMIASARCLVSDPSGRRVARSLDSSWASLRVPASPAGEGLGFRVWRLGFRVELFRVLEESKVKSFGFRVWRFRVFGRSSQLAS